MGRVRITRFRELYRVDPYLPRNIQLVISDKVGVITLQRIKDERLVRFGDLRVRKPPLICEVHLRRHGPRLQPWKLGVHLQVDGFGGLDTDHKLVTGNIFEDTLRDVFELDANLDFRLVQSYDEIGLVGDE